MKTKTLLMVAGAGALVYWLWKKVLTEEQKCKLSGGRMEVYPCAQGRCPEHCVNKDDIIKYPIGIE